MIRNFAVGLVLLSLLVASQKDATEREFDIAPGKKLDIDLKTGGSVQISGWDKSKVKVVVHSRGGDCEEVKIDFDERISGLSVTSRYDSRWGDNDCDIRLEIQVPLKFNLDIETMGGRIAIDGVQGEIEGETMGGELDLKNIKGEIGISTMGGSVTLKSSDVDGHVKTMGGNVLIKDVTGDVKGSTYGGNVTYKNVKQRSGKPLQASTMGGNLNISSRGGKVEAKTYGGDIDAEADEVHVSTMGGDITVKDAPSGADVHTMGGDVHILSAREYVKAKTMGGDIDVDAIDGSVQASTMGGDVTVTMTGDPQRGKRDVQISSMGGDISLTVPSGLSMDFDIELAYTKRSKQDYEIVSDFEMEIKETGEWKRIASFGSPRKYIYGTGKVGDGKNRIKIKTVNGNIYVRRGD